MSNEIMVVRDLSVISAEINEIKANATGILRACEAFTKQSVFEIGKRLVEAKEAVGHGNFGAFLETVEYSQSTANNLMRIYTEMGSDDAFASLSYSQLVALFALPVEERKALLPEIEDKSVREIKRLTDELKKAQEKEAEAKNKAVREYVRNNADVMTADAPILGNPEAKKTIYVWTAASCGYCRRVHGELERVLADRDDVKVVIKNFSIHGVNSDGPARAMIAAKIQDNAKAAKFVDMIMTREYRPTEKIQDPKKLAAAIEKNVMKFAEEAGLDVEQLKKDMQGEVVARELANVRDLAERFDITGTPFLIIGEEAFPGAIPAAQINAALDK